MDQLAEAVGPVDAVEKRFNHQKYLRNLALGLVDWVGDRTLVKSGQWAEGSKAQAGGQKQGFSPHGTPQVSLG
jgi:hypothetical protein